MLRLKSFLHPVFSRIPTNVYKLYSKAAELPEEALGLTDALRAKTDGIPAPTIVSDPSKLATIAQASADDHKSVESASGGAKKGAGCNKKVAPKGKKGKKCGQPKPVQPQDPGPPGGYYIQDKCGIYEIPKTNAKKWKTLSYALVPFALGLSAWVLATKGDAPEPEYIPYEYMYRRTKRFAWRDGKTSLFHGPNNLIPEEEEERLDREAEEKQAQAPPPKKGEKAPPPVENDKARYKKHANEEEEQIQRRVQHAQEELERRKKRHKEERASKEINDAPKEQSQ